MKDVTEEKDTVAEKKRQYILSQLKDIYEKSDLDDERILVFCQPVYNINGELVGIDYSFSDGIAMAISSTELNSFYRKFRTGG